MLGAASAHRFGARMPYLLKLLAADTPLSLQAHPSLEQARRGFLREEALGVPRTAAHRNYKDDNHKPELLCALTPFSALCGFRPPSEIARIFGALGVSTSRVGLTEPIEAANQDGGDRATLAAAFRSHFALTLDERSALVRDVRDRAERALTESTLDPTAKTALSWLVRLGELYPNDVGVVQSAFLNVLELAPFEAIYLPAGNLHAYLGGFGVEIMASSDNVLRGGLTPKHVDADELMRVLDFSPRSDWRIVPREDLESPREGGAVRYVYETPAPEFELSRVVVPRGSSISVGAIGLGPRILVATRGTLVAERARERIVAGGGDGVFIEDGGPVTLRSDGDGPAEGFVAACGRCA